MPKIYSKKLFELSNFEKIVISGIARNSPQLTLPVPSVRFEEEGVAWVGNGTCYGQNLEVHIINYMY